MINENHPECQVAEINNLSEACKEIARLKGQLVVLKEQASTTNVAGDKMPTSEYEIEVYYPSVCSEHRKCVWVWWLADRLEPWHIWRYVAKPDKKTRARARQVRRKHKARQSPGNKAYVRGRMFEL